MTASNWAASFDGRDVAPSGCAANAAIAWTRFSTWLKKRSCCNCCSGITAPLAVVNCSTRLSGPRYQFSILSWSAVPAMLAMTSFAERRSLGQLEQHFPDDLVAVALTLQPVGEQCRLDVD